MTDIMTQPTAEAYEAAWRVREASFKSPVEVKLMVDVVWPFAVAERRRQRDIELVPLVEAAKAIADRIRFGVEMTPHAMYDGEELAFIQAVDALTQGDTDNERST